MWKKVGDNMLIGEYHHNIDEKGRLIIPSKFREEIGNSFVVTKGLDGCLFVYSLAEWEKIVSKLQKNYNPKIYRRYGKYKCAKSSLWWN